MKNGKLYSIIAAGVVLIALGAWFLTGIGEIEKPQISFAREIRGLGPMTVLDMTLDDPKSGLRSLTVSITQDNASHVVASQTFSGKPTQQKVSVTVSPLAIKLHDGPATLTVTVTDDSLWGNTATWTKSLVVDMVPPQIFLLTSVNHINPGGSCLVLYRVSKPVSETSVQVNGVPFPVFTADISGKSAYLAYLPIPMDATSGKADIKITVRDLGGSETLAMVPRQILTKKFRADKMALSDNFMQRKMPEFIPYNPSLQGKPLSDVFTYVNTTLREDNNKTIREICRKSEPRQLWEGAFLRMKNAAPMAQFGDARTYEYDGKTLGESVHMGVDLASTANAPVEAANNGIVAYAGLLGIYGNMVMIDHGFGIFSLYSHLAVISVKPGQAVKRGDILGKSGLTGLAGGDHLHFSMIVGGQFVNPTEWWDAHWIKDNVTQKLAAAM